MHMRFKTSAIIMTALTGLFLLTTSCRKCSKCEYEYTTPTGTTQRVDMEEICGNTQDVDDQVASCQNLAAQNKGKCICVDM